MARRSKGKDADHGVLQFTRKSGRLHLTCLSYLCRSTGPIKACGRIEIRFRQLTESPSKSTQTFWFSYLLQPSFWRVS